MLRQAIIALALCAASGCASGGASDVAAILDEPLKNDGRVLDMTIFPYDLGAPNLYILCWEACTADQAATAAVALEPRVPGEFDGLHGDHPVRVRVRFEAYCFRPGHLCAEVRFFFREIAR